MWMCVHITHPQAVHTDFQSSRAVTIARAFTLSAVCSTVGHITLGYLTVDVGCQFCNKSSKIDTSSNIYCVQQYVLALQ